MDPLALAIDLEDLAICNTVLRLDKILDVICTLVLPVYYCSTSISSHGQPRTYTTGRGHMYSRVQLIGGSESHGALVPSGNLE